MTSKIRFTEQQIASIADVLANCHDWDTANSSKEAEMVLDFKDGSLDRLLTEFLKLDPRVRFASDFDHRRFVSEFQFRDYS